MRGYCVGLAACVLLGTAAVAGLNLAVDPYGIFGAPAIADFNEEKPRAGQRGTLAKLHRMRRATPRSIILGNSRADVGLDPAYEGWPADARPVANVAVPASGPLIARQLLDEALAANGVRTVVLGLEFLDFRVNPANPAGSDPPAPLALSDWRRSLRDARDALVSLDAAYDSVLTIAWQRRRDVPGMTPLGFNPMRDYEALAHRVGYHTLFDQVDGENAANYLHEPKQVLLPGTVTSRSLNNVRAMFVAARSQGARVHVVIYPYHAHILELFHESGLWDAFEHWKRLVVAMAEEESGRDDGGAPIVVWDFSGYSRYATEPVPEAGDVRTGMRWYWDAGHFKKALGDRVLARMFSPDPPADDGFGVRLASSDIDRHLLAIRAGREAYRAAQPREIARLKEHLERVRKTRDAVP